MKYDDEKENLDLDIKNSNEAIINLLQEVEIFLQKIEEESLFKYNDLFSKHNELLKKVAEIQKYQIKQSKYSITIFQELIKIKKQINQKDNQ